MEKIGTKTTTFFRQLNDAYERAGELCMTEFDEKMIIHAEMYLALALAYDDTIDCRKLGKILSAMYPDDED